MRANPYNEISGIQRSELFFNRRVNLQLLRDALTPDSPHCVSLLGQRKIGKTSLLLEFRRHYQSDYAERGAIIYFDCQRHQQHYDSAVGFFGAIAHAIRDTFSKRQDLLCDLKVKDTAGDAGVGAMLEKLDSAGLVTILFFDEFDKAVVEPALINGGVFGRLRSFGQHIQRFAWVTSTHQYLNIVFEESFATNHISSTRQRSESDFFNIAPPQIIGLFEQSEALDLAIMPAKTAGVLFTEEEVGTILRFGGHFPYFLQRMAHRMFHARSAGSLDHDRLVQESVKEAVPIWSGYLGKLTDRERDILRKIMLGESVNVSPEVEVLKDMSLIYLDEATKALRPFSETFGEYIKSSCIQHERTPSVHRVEALPPGTIKGVGTGNIEGVAARTNRPWVSGSFYLFAVVVLVVLGLTVAKTVPVVAVPAVFIFGLLAVCTIGILQLRQDERLAEAGFLRLVLELLRSLPMIKKR